MTAHYPDTFLQQHVSLWTGAKASWNSAVSSLPSIERLQPPFQRADHDGGHGGARLRAKHFFRPRQTCEIGDLGGAQFCYLF